MSVARTPWSISPLVIRTHIAGASTIVTVSTRRARHVSRRGSLPVRRGSGWTIPSTTAPTANSTAPSMVSAAATHADATASQNAGSVSERTLAQRRNRTASYPSCWKYRRYASERRHARYVLAAAMIGTQGQKSAIVTPGQPVANDLGTQMSASTRERKMVFVRQRAHYHRIAPSRGAGRRPRGSRYQFRVPLGQPHRRLAVLGPPDQQGRTGDQARALCQIFIDGPDEHRSEHTGGPIVLRAESIRMPRHRPGTERGPQDDQHASKRPHEPATEPGA